MTVNLFVSCLPTDPSSPPRSYRGQCCEVTGKIPLSDLGQVTTVLRTATAAGPNSSRTLPAAPAPGADARVLPGRRGASHPGVHCPHGSLSGCCPAEMPAPTPAQLQAQTRGYESLKRHTERRHIVPPRSRPPAQGPPLIGLYATVTRMFNRTPGSLVQT